MNKKLRIAGIVVAVIVSIVILSSPSQNPIKIPSPTTVSGNKTIEIVAENLEDPRSMKIDGNDHIYVAEKKGSIYLVREDKTGWSIEKLVSLDVAKTIDGGLLGIALHSEFENNRLLYAYHTYSVDNTADSIKNKVVSVKIQDNFNRESPKTKVILDNIPADRFNNGGALGFGPDGKLYIGTGAAKDDHNSQDLASLAGKILRVNPDGSVPKDNPFPKSAVFSYGHRNPSGIAWDRNGAMYASEKGPTKNDEINLIKAGGNYGWPHHECSSSESKFIDPAICYNPAVIPSGILFYDAKLLNIEKGNLLVSTLRGNGLFAVSFDVAKNKTQPAASGTEQISQNTILTGIGRIRDVAKDSNGYIYVLTANTDGRGFPEENDDRILKIKR